MKTDLRSVPPSGKFELDRREMIVGADFLSLIPIKIYFSGS